MIPGSNKDHPTLLESFQYASEGIITAFKTERNFKIMLAGAVVAILLGIFLKIDLLSWAVVIILIGLVLFSELINTSIETIVDLVSPEYHPLAKRAKDIAAGAVFIFTISAAIVGIIVYVRAFLICIS